MPAASDLALRYAQALAALRAIHDFDAWLGAHWHDWCPPPTTPPTAHTHVGAAGAITWHETADRVVGYLPGSDGCFQIARDLPLPDILLPGESSSLAFGTDVVISAAMQDELPPADR
jgi:hypothetical protein